VDNGRRTPVVHHRRGMTTSRDRWPEQQTQRQRSVVKISGPADIIGVLPHRLGFHPTESLVVVCLEGPRNRDRLVMRFDLPAEEHDPVLVDMVEQRIRAMKATGAILVVYTEQPSTSQGSSGRTVTPPPVGVVTRIADVRPSRGAGRGAGTRRDPRGLPRETLVELLTQRLGRKRVGVFEALLVHGGSWYSYHCADGRCCPTGGTPIAADPTPAAARYAAEAVLLGSSVLPSRDDLRRTFQPPDHAVAVATRRQGAADAGERLLAVSDAHGTDGARDLVVGTLLRLLDAWSDGGTAIDQDDASLVAVGLHDKRTRDEVMTFVLDHDGPLLVAVFGEIARRATETDAAPICTVLAWAAYSDGSGALAMLAAELVLDGLSRMVPPDTVRDICRQVRADLEGGGPGAALGSAG
jgi:hypothetical protein